MNSDKEEYSLRRQAEVVLMISGESPTVKAPASANGAAEVNRPGPKAGSSSSHQPPESGQSASPVSHGKPPLHPAPPELRQRRSFSKPKSRFVEQAPPRAAAQTEDSSTRPSRSPRATGGSPASTATPRAEDEEEDEEIYKNERHWVESNGKQRRCRCSFWALLEWAILAAAVACLVTSIGVPKLRGFSIWGLEIWKWCVMAIAICCGRLLTGWLVQLLVFLIERNFLLRKKVLYFVYGLKNSVRVCVWLGLVLLSWCLLFRRGVQRTVSTTRALEHVTRAIISLLVASLIWLVKTLMVKLLAASFHVNTFFDRIQESIFHQYVLQTLSGQPEMELAEKVGASRTSARLNLGNADKEKGKGKEGEGQKVIDVWKLHRLTAEKVSAWTMKGLINAISGSRYLTISDVIDESEGNEVVGEKREKEITGEWEAKAAALRIFKNVAKTDKKYIEEEDLLRFLSKEEVDIVLPQFEGASEIGKIKKSSFKNWVVKVYLERKSLAHSLNDTKTAVNQLHKLISAIAVVVIIMVTLLLMGIATTKVFVFLCSQLLLVVFIFGNTCKTAFEAIIFVFIMHPFDVGDRCVIDGVQMVVEEMNILTTVFLRYDNEKIYYPNSVLATKPISNFYRSPDMSDSVEFSIDFSTSVEKIATIKGKIKSYIDGKAKHWHPNHTVVVKDMVDVNKIKLALCVNHTMNHQNMAEKTYRRSELIIELKKVLEELSIRYNLPPQEVRLSYLDPTLPPLTTGR